MVGMPEIGDPLPWISVPTTRESRMPLNGLAGHRVALSFADASIDAMAIVEILDEAADILSATGSYWLIVTPAIVPAASERPAPRSPRARVIPDPDGSLRGKFKVAKSLDGVVSLLTDPGLRIAETTRRGAADGLLGTLNWLSGALMDNPPPPPAMDAPVLLVPDVIEADLRQRLIAVWSDGGHEASGYLRPNDDGSLVHVVNPGRKRRSDHFLDEASELAALVHDRVRRRVVPWIERATHFKVGFAERYRIACYDAETSGFFSAHRDFSEASPHRHFAMTICLNDGFKGGALKFSEFGDREYQLEPGQAVVYAGALLHEVTPVTSGKRFALVNFLTNGEGAKIVADYQEIHGTTPDRKVVK